MQAIDYNLLDQAVAHVKETWPSVQPRCGIILGSGWDSVAQAFTSRAEMSFNDIPGVGSPQIQGHSGLLSYAAYSDTELFLFRGRRHFYEGAGWTPVAFPIYLLRKYGVRIIVLTNAAGSIRGDLRPGELMMINDHINLMGANPLIGSHNPLWGARFPDLSRTYDQELRSLLQKAAEKSGQPLKEGVFCACAGPSYETPAEAKMLRTLGADAVGMSTVPSAVLARAAGLKVAGVSCISNMAGGVGGSPPSHQDVLERAKGAARRMTGLLTNFMAELHHNGLFAATADRQAD